MEQWIIPCNVNLYDVIGAFKKLKCLEWKQTNHSIEVGDDVFIYVGKPISSILFKCKVNKTNLPNTKIDDSEFILHGDTFQNYGNYMELELLEKYEESQFRLDVLVANGLKGRIQGPRRVNELGILLNKENWAEEIDKIISQETLLGDEKEVIAKVRVNQSVYRERLLKKHKTCCLCGVSNAKMLIASHIKPWCACDSQEKVDIDNGLLLCPNHDKAFDCGFITFSNQGEIILSDQLSSIDRILLNLREDMKVVISPQTMKYMEYHRENVFLASKQTK